MPFGVGSEQLQSFKLPIDRCLKLWNKVTSVIFDSVSELRGGTELLGESEGLGSRIASVEKGSDISFDSSRLSFEVGIRGPGGTDTSSEEFLDELERENYL